MAASPAAGAASAARSNSPADVERRATETKQSTKTSEFYAFIAVVIGILIAAAMIKGGDSGGTDEFIARQAWLYVSIVTAGYLVSRGLAKSGSRDPYSTDMRDRHDH